MRFYLKFNIFCGVSNNSGMFSDSLVLSVSIPLFGGLPWFSISSGGILRVYHYFVIFCVFLLVLVVFSDSLVLSASIPLFFRPQIPPGDRFLCKSEISKQLGTLV